MGNRMKASILGIVAAFALIGCRGSSKSNSVADNMENKPVIRPEKPVDSNVTMQDYLLIGAKGRAGKGSVYKCNLEGTKCREFLGGNIPFTSNNVTKEAKSNVIQLAMGDNFGSSIFGNKKNIFIGSNGKKGFDLYGKESSDSPNGAVYQCDLSGKNCSILDTTLLKLTANDSFGSSIFVTSSKILVGAIGRDSGDALPKIIGANYRFDLGAIFQFDLDGKNGVEFIAGKNKNSKIRDELKGNDYLGTSIVATKRNIFIGAKDKIRGNGRVFKCNLEGAECQSFYATDINFITNDNFGSSLAATDKQIFIGAIGRDSSPTNISSLYGKDNSFTNVSPLYDTGVVFSCNLDASSCVKLVGGRDNSSATDLALVVNDKLGSSIAVSGDFLYIGAMGRMNNFAKRTGAVFQCNLYGTHCVELIGGKNKNKMTVTAEGLGLENGDLFGSSLAIVSLPVE